MVAPGAVVTKANGRQSGECVVRKDQKKVRLRLTIQIVFLMETFDVINV